MKLKAKMLSVVLVCALVLSGISVISAGKTVQAEGNAIQYNNKVFTQKLYNNTKKIGFGSDGSQIVKDKKTVKKVYRLLAKMVLETKQANSDEEIKAGFVTVIIHTKDGKKKRYTFQDKEMNNKYVITKNYPINKIQKIYDSVKE